jgi:hypothetical protein
MKPPWELLSIAALAGAFVLWCFGQHDHAILAAVIATFARASIHK